MADFCVEHLPGPVHFRVVLVLPDFVFFVAFCVVLVLFPDLFLFFYVTLDFGGGDFGRDGGGDGAFLVGGHFLHSPLKTPL